MGSSVERRKNPRTSLRLQSWRGHLVLPFSSSVRGSELPVLLLHLSVADPERLDGSGLEGGGIVRL